MKRTLKKFRRLRRMTQVELARRSKVSQPEISQLENGKQRLGKVRAKRLAKALGCSLKALLG